MNCAETVYLVRNGGLHKIGITANFDRRVKELAPDHVQARLDLEGDENFTAADVERTLHARFKPLRLPQTEYFRLSNEDVLECCQIMKSFSEQSHIPIDDFVKEVVEEPMTPDQENAIEEFNRRAEILEKELDQAVSAGDEGWANSVSEQCDQLRFDLQEYKETLVCD